MSNFCRTTTEPRVLFQPRKHSDASRKLLEQTKAELLEVSLLDLQTPAGFERFKFGSHEL